MVRKLVMSNQKGGGLRGRSQPPGQWVESRTWMTVVSCALCDITISSLLTVSKSGNLFKRLFFTPAVILICSLIFFPPSISSSIYSSSLTACFSLLLASFYFLFSHSLSSLNISGTLTRGGVALGCSFSLMREMEPFAVHTRACLCVCVCVGFQQRECAFFCGCLCDVGFLRNCLCEILCVRLSQRVFEATESCF